MSISKNENSITEFKTNFSKEVIETVVAFSNTKGGVIYIGLDNSGKPTGIQLSNETLQNWYNIIKQSTEPAILVEINEVLIKKEKIISIKVDEFPFKPVSTKGRCYKRVNNSNHLLSIAEVAEIYLFTLQRSWDSYPSGEPDLLNKLNVNSLNKFIEDLKIHKRFTPLETINQTLEKLKLIHNKKCTKALEILFSDEHLYFIRAGKLKNQHLILDDKQFKGSIYFQLDDAYSYIIEKLEVRYEIVPGKLQRNEIWEYPLDVIREILLNAITHRDYHLPSDIQIKIYPDKITFYNPGKFYGDLKAEDLLTNNYQSRSRNLLISEIFYVTGKVEKYGTGYIRILQILESYPEIKLSVEQTGDGVLVTLQKVPSTNTEVPSTNTEVPSINTEVPSINSKYDKMSHKLKILSLLNSYEIELTTAEISMELQISTSRTREILRELIKDGVLKSIGENKNKRYLKR